MRIVLVSLVPALLLLSWQLSSSFGIVSAYLLPPPLAVLQAVGDMCESGVLPRHLYASLGRIALGFSISSSAGIILAGLTIRFKTLDALLAAPLGLLRMIPPLAMTPLLILWLGIGSTTQLSIIMLSSFFPIFLNTREGFSRIADDYRELARNLNLSTWLYVSRIVLPCATPSIITGLRLAFSYSWRALIGAELISAASGLGYMVMNAQEMLRTDEVIVGVLVIGVVGWALDSCFTRGTSRLLKRRFPELAV